jgi:hypothetical protein
MVEIGQYLESWYLLKCWSQISNIMSGASGDTQLTKQLRINNIRLKALKLTAKTILPSSKINKMKDLIIYTD